MMPHRITTISSTASMLVDLRTGVGAARLPSEVKKLTLLGTKRAGNATAKLFWRRNLPRIAYNNPDLEIEVKMRDKMNFRPKIVVTFDDPNRKRLSIPCPPIRKHDGVCRRLLHEINAVPALIAEESDVLREVLRTDNGDNGTPRWTYYSFHNATTAGRKAITNRGSKRNVRKKILLDTSKDIDNEQSVKSTQ